ncbi:MAG: hypothetical protein GY861_14055 [bacterium]|nr:hypothetical protein [bacterium]
MSKTKANAIVDKLRADGSIVTPGACANCKKLCTPIAHHDDYTKPSRIVFICRKCHTGVHARKIEIAENLYVEYPNKYVYFYDEKAEDRQFNFRTTKQVEDMLIEGAEHMDMTRSGYLKQLIIANNVKLNKIELGDNMRTEQFNIRISKKTKKQIEENAKELSDISCKHISQASYIERLVANDSK